MTKGKPWDINEIRQLRELIEEGNSVDEICKVLVKTRDAVTQKMFDLKLKTVKEEKIGVSAKKMIFSSSKLAIPAELPNVEETLKILAAAMLESAGSGLNKDEIRRLQVVGNLAIGYKDAFAEYLNYLGLEERLIELEAKYNAHIKKSQKNETA